MLNILLKIKDMLLAILSKIIPSIDRIITLMPFVAGVAIGYLFHGIIKIGVDLALFALKLLMKL